MLNNSLLKGALLKVGCKITECANRGAVPMTRSEWLRKSGNVFKWLISFLNEFICWPSTFEKSGFWLSWAARAQIETIWIGGQIRDAMAVFLLSPINFRYPTIEWLSCDARWSLLGCVVFFDWRRFSLAISAQRAVKTFRWLVLVPGRKIMANKNPVDRPSEAFDQESAGYNWLLTTRPKILKSGGSIDFLSISADSTEMRWITSWRKSRKQVGISQKVGWFDCKKKVYFSRSDL